MTDLHRIIWLASYPKSGNTWMRSLLAHYFMPKGAAPDINNLRQFTTGDSRADFFAAADGGTYTAQGIEDWLRVRPKALRLIAGSKPNHHFVKTHCQAIEFLGEPLIPNDVTAAAIYILRNPFDVALSYARHMNVDLDTAIERMGAPDNVMSSPNHTYDVLGRWDDHIDTWANAQGLSVHVVRYEDLLTKPGPTMRKLLERFLRVKVDQPKLAYAIKSTSFEAMRRQEEKLGFAERPAGMAQFFAKGQAGAWREDMTPAQVARVRELFLPALERWYPEVLKETANMAARV
ncbi:sulfotransferase [Roseobacter sp. AzwK-3b]|uniref:sulfotransferase domain-containing protein n=1 Tax=Roseobacter sp. AzwK-3b TaxID=351016 RepID=UPI000156A0A8|nr:sulfotransferase domain-containing protein [Roseobacter sp. AzwK-3b]EDM69440.1 sulfotransferase [Roseobacter sp. AzwK-3b]